MNQLYYGDNLEVLRRYVRDETVDLVYLDPPFKSNQDYNVLFAERDGSRSAAQFKAFEDTWEWNSASAEMYEEIVESGGRVSDVMQAFRRFLGTNDMLAYLTMMAPRLVELHRVLKLTGSIYLHCDPTASHYLKILLDAIFGPANLSGEVIWRRTAAHVTSRRWPRLHDTLLHYAKNLNSVYFEPPRTAADEGWVEREYRFSDERGRYMVDNLTGAGTTAGPSGKPWRGVDPSKIGAGRHWRYIPGTLDQLDVEGKIYWPKRGRYPKLKQYLHESKGKAVGDLWSDVAVIGRTANERLGYPTQKPEALLERIITASSRQNDVVLDPFCGCGTAISVAHQLGRQWIGIDITHLAIGLVKSRLRDAFGDQVAETYSVTGEPTSKPDALQLAQDDPFQFQWWALGLVGARRAEQRKGSDAGIDGRLYFHDEGNSKTKQIILSVKSGHVSVRDIRDLRGVIEREEAQIGVLLTLQEPTRPMEVEAAGAGRYVSQWGKHPRLQILTIDQLLEGQRINYPHGANVTLRRAPRAAPAMPEQLTLPTVSPARPHKVSHPRKKKRAS